jgi:diguanylate cyclase (GGDEF)-like protein
MPEHFLSATPTHSRWNRRLVPRLNEAFNFGEKVLHVTASFGAAGFRGSSAQELSSVIALADGALYRAKQTGRNRVEIEVLQEQAKL